MILLSILSKNEHNKYSYFGDFVNHSLSFNQELVFQFIILEPATQPTDPFTVEPPTPTTAASQQRPFFCPHGQSMHSLLFKPLYNGPLSTTATAIKARLKLTK